MTKVSDQRSAVRDQLSAIRRVAAPWWRTLWQYWQSGRRYPLEPTPEEPEAPQLPARGPERQLAPPTQGHDLPQPMVGPVRPRPPERFFTPAALQRAWLAIRRAGGGAGVDGETLQSFAARSGEELAHLRADLTSGRYRPRPIRQVLVPKANGGLRPLAMWALRDRIAQRVMYDIIAPSFEAIFLPCSVGFRPGKGVEDAVQMVTTYRDQDRRWVMDGDIRHCFDEIDSGRLVRLVARRVHDRLLLHYIEGWLEAEILNSADGVPKKAGTSQGSALSPLLANVYLHEVDRTLMARQLALVRYADNFVVCCQSESEAEAALVASRRGLGRWGLALNPQKTRIVHFDQGFGWLGYFFIRDECYRV